MAIYNPLQNGEGPAPDAVPSALPPLVPDVDRFDCGILPARLAPWVRDIADRISCPPEFVAIPAMVAAGAAIGRGLGVRPKRNDHWTVFPNLWGCCVGPPGSNKTDAMEEVLRPLNQIEGRWHAGNRDAMKLFEKRLAAHKMNVKRIEQEYRRQKTGAAFDSAAIPDPPERPPERRIKTNDPTPEKLIELLRDNPRGSFLCRDELAGWLREFDKPGREGARQLYLEGWSGNGSYVTDRIGRGTIMAPKLCMSVLGGIQPGPFRDHLQTSSQAQFDDGLLERFSLLAWPDDVPFVLKDTICDPTIEQEAAQVYEDLVQINAENGRIVGEYDAERDIKILRFDREVQDEVLKWLENLMFEIKSAELADSMKSHFSKYRKAIPALALLTELVDNPDASSISASSWRAALSWERILRSHAHRVYAPATDPALCAGHRILDKILQGALSNEFTAREIYRKNWAGLADSDIVVSGLQILEEYGWIAHSVHPSGGRPSERYRVHEIVPTLVRFKNPTGG